MPRAPKPNDGIDRHAYDEAIASELRRTLFPEPDHEPELKKQERYAEVRDNPYLGTADHPARCTIPSHQQWAVEMFGAPHDYESCTGF